MCSKELEEYIYATLSSHNSYPNSGLPISSEQSSVVAHQPMRVLHGTLALFSCYARTNLTVKRPSIRLAASFFIKSGVWSSGMMFPSHCPFEVLSWKRL